MLNPYVFLEIKGSSWWSSIINHGVLPSPQLISPRQHTVSQGSPVSSPSVNMVKQEMVMKLSMEDAKKRCKALKTAAGLHGVISVKLDGDKIVVVGDGVDSVVLTNMLRKKMGHAELVKVGSAEAKKEEKEADGSVIPVTWTPHFNLMPPVCEIRETYHDPCRIM
ncbi:hypothetical protein OPV22_018529 [Ensete ventricosum]|uniref:HMA domain-containing protein n=1 Tax=Ensete ventricosum TaxID=4639 RepID=A0AAV8R4I2_ENSVE|nr:hypothetical protein OPV22_018529 [Ensete ventricosum]